MGGDGSERVKVERARNAAGMLWRAVSSVLVGQAIIARVTA